MFRFRLMLLVIMVLLLPQGVFAETLTVNSGANLDTNPEMAHAHNLIKRKMRMYHHYNIQMIGDDALFFAFHKTNNNIPFGWYRLDLTKKFGKAHRIVTSSEFSMLFQTAFSPDGREMIVTSKTGEVVAVDISTGKRKSLGAFVTDFGYSLYSFPTYTPDGNFFILFNQWENELLIVDSRTKDIGSAKHMPGFWIYGSGGTETPDDGSNISLYRFSDDGTRMTFINGAILNLETFTKE